MKDTQFNVLYEGILARTAAKAAPVTKGISSRLDKLGSGFRKGFAKFANIDQSDPQEYADIEKEHEINKQEVERVKQLDSTKALINTHLKRLDHKVRDFIGDLQRSEAIEVNKGREIYDDIISNIKSAIERGVGEGAASTYKG
jgi:hypothetical protein